MIGCKIYKRVVLFRNSQRTIISLKQDYDRFKQNFSFNESLKDPDNLQKLKSQLNDNQIKSIEMISDCVNDMDIYETQYFQLELQKLLLERQTNKLSLAVNFKNMDEFVEPNPNAFIQIEKLKELYPKGMVDFYQVVNNIGNNKASLTVAGSEQQSSSSQQEAQKKEEVKEQTNFDVELTAIDSAQKIKIIKEVRTLCGLGLKEAKEAVEKVPTVLAKQATKDDSEKMQEALKKLGCTVVLK